MLDKVRTLASPLATVIKIKNDALRGLLLTLIFPFYFVVYILKAALPVKLGGHPNGQRLLQADFYMFPIGIYVAALRGGFV